MDKTIRKVEVGISLGSNEGDRLANLRAAVEALQRLPGFEQVAKSPVYETDPVDVRPQFAELPFLNAILIGMFERNLASLGDAISSIERAAGRIRAKERNLPRPLDIDVIYFGNTVCSEPLQVPHPRWAIRRFVVQPLCDLRPDLVLPGEQRTVREVLFSLPAVPRVVPLSRAW
jgi:2-amino-4-hydroxy-6-hydroxymethyldihydropteridine diphosphokinase